MTSVATSTETSTTTSTETPFYLKNKNPHPRDSKIVFDEGPHIYTIDGDSDYTSVTTWNHANFEKFNADKIITKMMKGKRWNENNKYYGMSREQIKEMWNKNGKDAAEAGTKLHYDIECFYNNCPNENNSVEYGYFNNFQEKYSHLTPYRTEWEIYDKELKLAGSIDMIYENADGTLLIYDWKRCKDIPKTNSFSKSSTNSIISHLPDTKFWHYSLQLNTYKAILEKNYGKKITDMYLVCLHPNNENYQRIQVANLSSEMADLFEQRKKQLENKQLENKQLENKQLENKQLENKQLENK